MALPTEEEKKRYTAFPHNPPPPGRVYGESQARGLTKQSQPAAPPVAQPLDAQAAADRRAISSGLGFVKGVNQKLGAAIADIGTMPVRAAAGAYDTAVIRPMRAAGINAAFTSPMVNPSSNADGSSMTPFMDQIRTAEAKKSAAQAPATPQMPDPVRVQEARSNITQPPSVTAPVAAKTMPTQQVPELDGVDVGFGLRRIDRPGEAPLYTNAGAAQPASLMQTARQPSQPQWEVMDRKAEQPQRSPVAMPVLNTRGGVFASMANFANQASNAYGAVAQNRAANQQSRADREDTKMGLEANRYALDAAITQNRFGMDRERAGLDAAKVQDDMATNQLRRNASQLEIATAQQVSDLQRKYLEAPDEAARAEVAKKIAALSGKGEDAGDQIKIITAPATTAADGFTQIPGGQRLVRIGRDGTVSDITPQQGQQDQSQKQPYKKGELYTRTQGGKDVKVEFAGYDPVTGKEQWKSF